MRRLVAHGALVGAVVGLVYGLLALVLWLVLPSVLSLPAGDRAALGPPLALLVVILVVAYPLRVFTAIVVGLQDVTFNGALAIGQSCVNISITAVMLLAGFGLYAPATGAAVAAVASVLAAWWRVHAIAPDLLRGWPRPTFAGLRTLLGHGLGAWSGALGWQLQSASTGLVITSLGRPEWIAVFACTSKLTSLTTQLAWVIPDAGLVGLAQVRGEQPPPQRLAVLVMLMLRLHLLLAGGAACVLLVLNPAFVRHWVGAPLFAGTTVNLLLSLAIVAASLAHGLMTSASVIGNRVRVGTFALVHGAVQVVVAWGFGVWWGLAGVAAASLAASLLIAIPAGAYLVRPATGLTVQGLWRDVLRPWALRAAPVIALSGAAGLRLAAGDLMPAVVVATSAGALYVVQMRTLLTALPIAPRWARWLVSLRVLPAPAAQAVAVGQR